MEAELLLEKITVDKNGMKIVLSTETVKADVITEVAKLQGELVKARIAPMQPPLPM